MVKFIGRMIWGILKAFYFTWPLLGILAFDNLGARFVILLVGLYWINASVGEHTKRIEARRRLSVITKELTKASEKPPDGMSKEAWVSLELGKIEQVIVEAELQAEHDWRIENDEHEGCAKCLGDTKCLRDQFKQVVKTGIEEGLKPPAKPPSAAIKAKPGIVRAPNLAFIDNQMTVIVKLGTSYYMNIPIFPSGPMDRTDIIFRTPEGSIEYRKGESSSVYSTQMPDAGCTWLASIHVRAGATSITDEDIHSAKEDS